MVAALLSPEVTASLPVGSSSSSEGGDEDPQRVILDVGAELRFRGPERFVGLFRSRVARSVHVRRGRRKVAERYDPIREAGRWWVAPRGLVKVARDVAQRMGLEIETRRSVLGEPRDLLDIEAIAERAGKPARPYQAEAARLLHTQTQGYVVVPCGGGKTWIGVLAIAGNRGPATVVVGSEGLRRQWIEALTSAGIEVVSGGAIPRTGQATVVLPKSMPPALLTSSEILLVDELHHIPAATWAAIVSKSTARWRWGLTATPDRSDGMSFLLDYLVGPRLLTVPHEHLIANGWIYRPALVPWLVDYEIPPACRQWSSTCTSCRVASSFALNAFPRRCPRKGCPGTLPDTGLTPSRVEWTAALSAWAKSEVLTSTVDAILDWGVTNRRTALVLVPRVETARALAAHLRDRGIRAAPLVGGDELIERRISDLRRGRVSVLVGTTIADEALDIPEADLIVLASLGKAKGTHEQRAGRSTRPAGHPVPIVVDLVPTGMMWQWPSRRDAFRAAFGDAPRDPLAPAAALDLMQRLHRTAGR